MSLSRNVLHWSLAVIVILVASSSFAYTYNIQPQQPDNSVACLGLSGQELEACVMGGGGSGDPNAVGQRCRATWNVPSTYCWIQVWYCNNNGVCTQDCAQGINDSAWCECKNKQLTGQCSFN